MSKLSQLPTWFLQPYVELVHNDPEFEGLWLILTSLPIGQDHRGEHALDGYAEVHLLCRDKRNDNGKQRDTNQEENGADQAHNELRDNEGPHLERCLVVEVIGHNDHPQHYRVVGQDRINTGTYRHSPSVIHTYTHCVHSFMATQEAIDNSHTREGVVWYLAPHTKPHTDQHSISDLKNGRYTDNRH